METEIEGVPESAPHSVSGAFQDYNDPPPDSLFTKRSREVCVCIVCGAAVYNNTESRDGHLNRAQCHV